jgi:heme exporter protein A
MSHFTGQTLTCVRGERRVFAHLDFTVESGGALLLVGPNGSGKSSLLRVMAGLLRPFGGMVAWDGGDILDDTDAHNARLHYVGHLDAVKPVMTVAENLGFWAGLRSDAGNLDAIVKEALETFGIGHLADVPGRFLSAGQKRRVNLARLLAAPATLWLLDEPTTALDRAAIASLEAAIARHRSGGGMVCVCTHVDLGIDGARTLDLGNFSGKRAPGAFDGVAA